MIWERFDSRLLYKAELIAQTGLRVGAGAQSAEPTASDLPVMKTPDGKPFIPGSSLRGVLRSHVERIVRALEPDNPGGGEGACNPLSESNRCVTKDDIDTWEEHWRKRLQEETDADSRRGLEQRHGEERASWIWDRTCRVCRVFGSPWLASRVRISDLLCVNGAEAETRDAVSIDREKETVENKYDFEAVPIGSRFRLEIVADNLDEPELGLLWLGIEELAREQIYVGGFKGRGLGQVALERPRIFLLDKADLPSYLLTGEMPPCDKERAQDWMKSLLQHLTGGDD